MQITNTTKWNTNDLRKLFGRCVQEVRKVEGRGENKGIIVKVRNCNSWGGKGTGGRAFLGYYKMSISIGTKTCDGEKEMSLKDRIRLAQVFTHEYYHNLGYKSQDFRNYRNDWTKKMDYDWVKNYQIGLEPEKEIVKKDIQMERYMKVMAKVGFYQTRLKRNQNLLKKYRVKQRYYERTLVAAGKIPKVEK